jgi:hypothetical protein
MKSLKINVLCLLMAVLPACGQQLVEFPLGDGAAGGNTGDGGKRDANPVDGPRTEGGVAVDGGVTADVNVAGDGGSRDGALTNLDAAVTTDALRTDVLTVDASTTDVLTVDAPALSLDVLSLDVQGVDLMSLDMKNDMASACAQLPVSLGSAGNFVVLAGSTVTSTGPTSVTGDLGVSPGTAVTGFPPGIVVGNQHAGDPTSAQGIADLTIAYNDAAGRTLCPVTVSGNLGGMTLAPGLYKSTSSLEISSGDLVLDGQGDPNAVFIFQMASTFTTTSGRQIMLVGGAKSINVYWQVGTSATLGSTSSFQGTLMADQAITLNTGATVNGRLLARIAAVALDSNTIVAPTP